MSDEPEIAPPSGEADMPPAPPADIPAKFWDAEAGQVRVEALAKSYRELERRLSAREAAAPETYDIAVAHGLFEPDADLNARLREAGFTAAQAQLVYDLAAERLQPMARAMAQARAEQADLDRLQAHFGGPAKWAAAHRQLAAWGRAHLPAPAYAALADSYDGVLTLHRMMTGAALEAEPRLLHGGGGGETMSATRLRRMVADPRYWRDRDPAFMRDVAEGFRRLYPGAP